MAIHTVVGGVDAGLVSSGALTLDRNTGQLDVVDTSSGFLRNRGGSEICIEICCTDDDGLNPIAYSIKAPVNPLVLTAEDITLCTNENPAPLTTLGTLSASGGVGAYVFGGAAGDPLIIDPDGTVLVNIDPLTQGLVNPPLWEYDNQTTWTFTFNVTDSAGTAATGTITIELKEVPQAPQLNPSTANLKINETEPIGFSLGDAATLFGNSGWALAEIVGGNSLGHFAITPGLPGTITTTTTLDADTVQDYTLSIKLTNANGLSSIGVLLVSVNSPPVVAATHSFSFAEDVAVGHAVGAISFSDPQGGVILVSISADDPTDPGKFSIDQSGNLTTLGTFDHAAQDTYQLTLEFEDDCGLTSETVVTISLEEALVVDQKFDFDENSPVGFAIATLPATSSTGTIAYSITSGDPLGEFTFNANTLEANALVDHETTDEYFLVVSATDGVRTSSATITVCVNDVNEPPTVVPGGPYKAFTTDPAGTSYGFVTSTDPDATGTAGGTYTILNDPTGGLVLLDPTTGEITRSGNPPPAAIVHTITVQFTDADGAVSVDTFDIDLCAVLELTSKVFAFDENVPFNTTVGPLVASGGSAPYQISLIAGGTGPTAAFFVAANNNLVVGDPTLIDFETQTPNPFTLMVRVVDANNDAVDCPVTVTLNDINDAPSSITGGPFAACVTDPANTVYGFAIATDPDLNGTVGGTYDIIGGNTGSVFAIDSATGEIRRSLFGTLMATTYNLIVRFADADGLSVSDTITIVGTPEIALAPKAFSFPEDATNGTIIGGFTPTGGSGTGYTLTITGGTGPSALGVDASNNLILTDETLINFETQTPNPFEVEITVTDSNGKTLVCPVDVTVTDVNEAPTSVSGGPFSGVATAPANTVLGTVVATDPDTNGTVGGTFSIIAGNPSGWFAIDPTTGVLTLTGTGSPVAGTSTLTVQFTDADGLSVTGAVDVELTGAAGPTIVFAPSNTRTENATANGTPQLFALYMANVIETNPAGNPLTLTVSDPTNFEVIPDFYGGYTLNLRAGVVLDPINNPTMLVTVSVDDPLIPPSPNDSILFTLNVI